MKIKKNLYFFSKEINSKNLRFVLDFLEKTRYYVKLVEKHARKSQLFLKGFFNNFLFFFKKCI